MLERDYKGEMAIVTAMEMRWLPAVSDLVAGRVIYGALSWNNRYEY